MQDLNKAPDDILVDLINLTNASSPNYTPYGYGVLQFKDVAAIPAGGQRNTTIKVTDMVAPNDSDWMSLFYNRVSLVRPLHRIEPYLRYVDTWTSVHDILTDLNARFNINVTVDDVEDDAIELGEGGLPFTLAIRAKEDSKIYIGTASIELIDPDTGIGIIEENTEFQEAINPTFTNEGDLFIDDTIPTDGFFGNGNAEIEVSGRIFKTGDNSAASITDDVYSLALEDSDTWGFVFNFGLTNTENGDQISDLYNLRILAEANGHQRIDLMLYKVGNVYHFRSQDRSIDIVTSHVGGDGSFLQGKLLMSDYPDAIAEETKNGAGAPLGDFRIILIAERKAGNVPQVAVELNMTTDVVAGVGQTLFQDENTLQLIADAEDPYELPFMWQVVVSGPAGIPTTLEEAIDVTLTLPAGASFSVNPIVQSGISINQNGTGTLPAGLAKGTYEIAGVLLIPTNWSAGDDIALEIEFETPGGVLLTQTATWDALPAVVVGDAPTITAIPQITGDAIYGEIATIVPGTYDGTAPLTIERHLIEFDSEGGILNDTVLLLEELTFEVPSGVEGRILMIREIVSNDFGEIYGYSASFGPLGEPAESGEGGPPVLDVAGSLAGDREVDDEATLTPSTWTGTAPIAVSYKVVEVEANLTTVVNETVMAEGVFTFPFSSATPGNYIKVVETATNSYGEASNETEFFGPLPRPFYERLNGDIGVFDFSDLSTFSADTAGTTPVTAANTLAKRINDKTFNNLDMVNATGWVVRGTPQGPNLLGLNGLALADSNAVRGAGWALGDGRFVATNASSDLAFLPAAVPGKTYLIRYTSTATSGNVRSNVGGVNGGVVSDNRLSEEYVVATGTGALKLTGAAFTGEIRNVEIYAADDADVAAPYRLQAVYGSAFTAANPQVDYPVEMYWRGQTQAGFAGAVSMYSDASNTKGVTDSTCYDWQGTPSSVYGPAAVGVTMMHRGWFDSTQHGYEADFISTMAPATHGHTFGTLPNVAIGTLSDTQGWFTGTLDQVVIGSGFNEMSTYLIERALGGNRAIISWGDSTTAGSLGNSWPLNLSSMLGLTVGNHGSGGQSSELIAGRFDTVDNLRKREWTNIFWMGTNDNAPENTWVPTLGYIASCVAKLKGKKRFLVLGVMVGDGAVPASYVDDLDAQLLAIYGDRFVDIRAFLQSHGDGSTQDNEDIANGLVPTSLREDIIHLNGRGNQLVALYLAQILREKGWA